MVIVRSNAIVIAFARTGKNLACNNDEQSGYPNNPPSLNGNDMYFLGVMGKMVIL